MPVCTGAVVLVGAGGDRHRGMDRIVGIEPADDAEHDVLQIAGLVEHVDLTAGAPPAVIENGVRVIGVGASVTAGASSEA